MSQVFDIGDRTVWSPALRVGECYLEQLRAAERLTGRSAALVSIAADYHELSAEGLREVVEVLADASRTHPMLGVLMSGFLATSLVMLHRAGAPVSNVPAHLAALREAASAVMPEL